METVNFISSFIYFFAVTKNKTKQKSQRKYSPYDWVKKKKNQIFQCPLKYLPFQCRYCKTVLIFVAHCYPEILPVFVKRILKTPTTLGSVLQKREWRVLSLLPTFVQFRLRTLFLALMSRHKNAASSPAQSPSCFADLYIYVVRASVLCQRTAAEIIFPKSAMWHTVLV